MSILSGYQRRVWDLLFERDDAGLADFFFVGGTAIAEFFLSHRRSEDFDLFASRPDPDLLERTSRSFEAALGEARRVHTSPDFRRLLLTAKDGESLKIDLAFDPSLAAEAGRTVSRSGLRLPSEGWLRAAKVCAALGRSDLKDLIDLFWLDRKSPGRLPEDVARAARMDGGLTPETLGWSLSQIEIPDASPPYLLLDTSMDDLRRFRDGWAERLRAESLR